MSNAIIKHAVRRSHTSITKVELLKNDGSVEDTLTETLAGAVEIDSSNAIRRSASLVYPDKAIYDELFRPGVTEVKVYRGVLLKGGVKHYASLGVFGVSEWDNNAVDKMFGLRLFDRSRRISRRGLLNYYEIAAGTNYGVAIRALLESRYPGLQYQFEETPFLTPHLIFAPQDDPWKRAQEMATAIGMNIYFSVDGAVRLFPVQDANKIAPSTTYSEDGKNVILLDVKRTKSDVESYNKITVTSNAEGDAPPAFAVAVDDVATSPTYIGNPHGSSDFGEVPFWIESQYVLTQPQCQTMANAELNRRSGLVESVEISTLVDPTLEADEVVAIDSPTGRVNNTYAIESMSMPLSPTEALALNMRKKNVK